MSLQIIGAGFGRTGTNSLKVALEQLGFSRCHHMKEVAISRFQVRSWYALSKGEKKNWDDVFRGFAASCDWPSSAYWEELYRYYPQSRIILTVRDEEGWYRSARETIYPVSQLVPRWLIRVSRWTRELDGMITNVVWDGIFKGQFENRDYALGIYREHVDRVKQTIDPARLLIFEAKDGWEPLCSFLEVPIPDMPYPHVNEAAEIKRIILALRILRYFPMIALVMSMLLFWRFL